MLHYALWIEVDSDLRFSRDGRLLLGVGAEPQLESQSRLRIQVDWSRVVFGVADPTGSLEYGECFFQPAMDGQPHVFEDTYLLVVGALLPGWTGSLVDS